jgi:hypothetical protein
LGAVNVEARSQSWRRKIVSISIPGLPELLILSDMRIEP